MVYGIRHDAFHFVTRDSGVTFVAGAGGARTSRMQLLDGTVSER